MKGGGKISKTAPHDQTVTNLFNDILHAWCRDSLEKFSTWRHKRVSEVYDMEKHSQVFQMIYYMTVIGKIY